MAKVSINNPQDDYDNVKVILPNGSTVATAVRKDISVAVSSNVIVGAGADRNYVHLQPVPSDTWAVSHSLGKKPSVMVVDSADDVVYGDINYVDDNNVIITFNGAFSGKAYFN